MLATIVASERLFSSARCIKMCLHSARMSQQGLNHLMLLKSMRTALKAYINVVDVGNDLLLAMIQEPCVWHQVQSSDQLTQIHAIVYY